MAEPAKGAEPVKGWLFAGVAVLAAAAIGLAGSAIPAEEEAAQGAVAQLSGRTSSVCTTSTADQSTSSADSGTQVAGVSAKADESSEGSLTTRELGDEGSGKPAMSVSTQGQGKVITGPEHSLVMTADGVMAGASAGMVYNTSADGENRGLSLAPCVTPAAEEWFTGLGASDGLRSQLVLTNPDDKQAEVDLEFYDDEGQLSVPGGSGLIITAGKSRTVSLTELLGETKGEITVKVHSTVGRVSAIGRTLRTNGDGAPSGADWHGATLAPTTSQVIPGVPGGPGTRQLIISNTGDRRAEAKIEVLGPDGAFAPIDADQVTVEAQSVETVDVAEGLAKQIGTVRISSDQPVLTSIRSERPGKTKPNDIAIQTAQAPINNLALAPIAVVDGSETELAISNSAAAPTTADVSLINMDGVSLYQEEIPVAANATVERRVTQAGPAYLVVRAPDGSQLYAGYTLRQLEGDVYGLASASLITPALAGGAIPTENDPRVAQ